MNPFTHQLLEPLSNPLDLLGIEGDPVDREAALVPHAPAASGGGAGGGEGGWQGPAGRGWDGWQISEIMARF